MLWLFHRGTEYLSCEVRTCLRNHGFEVVMTYPGHPPSIEWLPNESGVQRRWEQIARQLRSEGWGEFSEWDNRERSEWARAAGRGVVRFLLGAADR